MRAIDSRRGSPGDDGRRSVVIDILDPDLRDDVHAAVAAVDLDCRDARDPGGDGPVGRPGSPPSTILVVDAAGRRTSRGYPGIELVIEVRSDSGGDESGAAEFGGGGTGAETAGQPPNPPPNATTTAPTPAPAHALSLPSETERLVDLLARSVESAAGTTWIVTGAVGGCGTSTLATMLAGRASAGGRVMLVETDPLGVGLDALLGVEGEEGLRIDELDVGLGSVDVSALWSAALRLPGDVGVLPRGRIADRGIEPGRVPGVGPGSAHVVTALRRAGDVVICDAGRAPRGNAPPPVPGDRHVLVTRGDLTGALAARDMASVGTLRGPVALVVRDAGPSSIDADDIAAACGLADVWRLPSLRGVPRVASAGRLAGVVTDGSVPRRRGLGALAAVADELLEWGEGP